MLFLAKTALHRLTSPALSKCSTATIFKLNNLSFAQQQAVRLNLKRFCSKTVAEAPKPNMAPEIGFNVPLPKNHKIIGLWLLSTAGLVTGAVLLGGITRLTESGLSMVEWNLIKDLRQPQTEEEWKAEFEKYQQFPEYKHKSDVDKMTLEQFKNIYYWEYSHRMFGRFIGMWFLLPAAYFWARGYLNPYMKKRIAVFGSLLIGQGAMGWYMVKSGLKETENVPRVSPYRLSAHLGLAMVLYAGTLWTGLTLVLPQVRIPDSARYALVRRMAHPLMAFVFVTAMSGAFVAGNDAGLHYNSWPKMADRWIPTDLWVDMSPKWRNFFENATLVQFNHRLLGESAFLAILAVYLSARRIPGLHSRGRLALNSLMAMAAVQVGLGISTLLYYVPIELAAAHQSGAMALMGCAIWFAHELRRWKIPIKK